jgi:hypothetical protein
MATAPVKMLGAGLVVRCCFFSDGVFELCDVIWRSLGVWWALVQIGLCFLQSPRISGLRLACSCDIQSPWQIRFASFSVAQGFRTRSIYLPRIADRSDAAGCSTRVHVLSFWAPPKSAAT